MPLKLFSRTDNSLLGRWWWTVDRAMLLAVLALSAFGIALVTAASPAVAERIELDSYHFIIRHMVFLLPALAGMIVISMMSERWIWRFASLALAGGLLMMVIVLFTGAEIKGAQRWIPLFGFSLQPSEFVKPAFIVVAAWLMSRQKEIQGKPVFYYATAGLYGLVALLLLLQPDFGMTFLITCVLAAQVFMTGLPFRYVAFLGAGGMAMIAGAYFAFGHVRSRIDRFLDPESGDNYQVDKALAAFEQGGLIGAGPGQGSVKMHIPDAHSDFIFAVAGEELGFLFLIAMIALYAFVMLRGFHRLGQSDNLFAVLAAGGLLVMIGFQAFIHMGSNVNILPTKGMTLPFVSYGGSSLLASALAMGMVLALTRKSPRAGVAKGRVMAGAGG